MNVATYVPTANDTPEPQADLSDVRKYFPLWLADVRNILTPLSSAGRGAMMMLLMAAWERLPEGLPDEPTALKRLSVYLDDDWASVWDEIRFHWRKGADGLLFNAWLMDQHSRAIKNRIKGAKGGRARSESKADAARENGSKGGRPAMAEPRVPAAPQQVLTMEQQRRWRTIAKHYANHPEVIEDLTQQRKALSGAQLDQFLEEQLDVFRFDD